MPARTGASLQRKKRQAGVSQRELIRASGLQLNQEINRCLKMPPTYPGQDEKRGGFFSADGKIRKQHLQSRSYVNVW